MNIIANLFGWLTVAYFVSIPFIWIWVFLWRSICRKELETIEAGLRGRGTVELSWNL